MKSYLRALLVGVVMLPIQGFPAAMIFDDFNVSEGHFGYSPTFAGQTAGADPTSTAVLVTGGDALEGAGYQRLVLAHDTSSTALRIRHLSGGPPNNSANAGTPVGNPGFSFTTSGATDGFIGFYLRSTATGWVVSLNLDGPGGTGAEMDGSAVLSIESDGVWHLYEWDLDGPGWGVVPSIGGGHGGLLQDVTHTIDSIYFRDLDGEPGPTAQIDFDFVARNDAGSIADLIPEPSALLMAALGGLEIVVRRRRA